MSTEHRQFVIDRFEGHWAILVSDDGATFEIDRVLLPEGSREGVALRVPSDGPREIRWESAVVDEEATEERLRAAKDVLGELKKRDPGGDVVL